MTDPSDPDAAGERDAPTHQDVDPKGAAQLRAMWQPILQAIVDAAQGDLDAAEELATAFQELDRREEWRDLRAVLQRIVDGARDEDELLDGLDVVDAVLARAALEAVAAPHPAAAWAERDEHAQLDEFLTLVERACHEDGPDRLREQIRAALARMAADDAEPAATRALGRVLGEILAGERAPDLTELTPPQTERVRALLNRLS